MFKKAIELDPSYAAAYAALGWVYLQEWQLQWTRDPEDLERAFELAQKAIALDDSLANCHSLLSQIVPLEEEVRPGDRRGRTGGRARP